MTWENAERVERYRMNGVVWVGTTKAGRENERGNEKVKRADHRADAFLMEINVQVRLVLLLSTFSCSWLSLSLQAT